MTYCFFVSNAKPGFGAICAKTGVETKVKTVIKSEILRTKNPRIFIKLIFGDNYMIIITFQENK